MRVALVASLLYEINALHNNSANPSGSKTSTHRTSGVRHPQDERRALHA